MGGFNQNTKGEDNPDALLSANDVLNSGQIGGTRRIVASPARHHLKSSSNQNSLAALLSNEALRSHMEVGPTTHHNCQFAH